MNRSLITGDGYVVTRNKQSHSEKIRQFILFTGEVSEIFYLCKLIRRSGEAGVAKPKFREV